MRLIMIRENNNFAIISCFIVFLEKSICMDYPNYDVTPTFNAVTVYAISVSGYPGIISSLGLPIYKSTKINHQGEQIELVLMSLLKVHSAIE